MRFRRMRFLQQADAAGGIVAGLNPATGLPFVGNQQVTSPSSGGTATIASPGFARALQGGEAAFADKGAALRDELAAKEQEAKIRANIAEGYGPMAGVQPPESQQFARTPGGFPVAIPQDEPDPFETKRAVGQAARDAAYMQELERQKAAADLRIKAAHEDYNKRYADAVAAQKMPGFWEDKTEEQKSRARLGMWLSAIGAGFAKKESSAIKYINEAIDRDTKQKAGRADRLMRLAEQSKGSLSEAYRMRAEELSNTTLQHAAMVKGLADYADAFISTMLPAQQQSQARQKQAELEVEANKWLAQAHQELNTKTNWQSGHTVTTTALDGNKGVGGLSAEAVTNAVTFRQHAKALDEFGQIIKRNPEALKIFQDAHRQEMESDELGKTSLGKTVATIKGLGASPMSVDQRIANLAGGDEKVARDARRLNMIFPIMKTGVARFSDPVGPLGESAQRGAVQHMNLITSKPEEVIESAKWFSSQFRDKAEAIEQSKMSLQEKAMLGNQPTRQPSEKQQPRAEGSAASGAAPTRETLQQLIQRGKALKKAGDIAGARKAHAEAAARIEKGER